MNYSDFLKNKKIALVGPSRSVEGSIMGNYVDSCDVVIRMIRPSNPTFLIPDRLKLDIGTRTDVVYSNFDIPNCPDLSYFNYLKDQGVKYINSTRPTIEIPIYPTIKNNIISSGVLYSNPSVEKYNGWSNKLKSSPHSGYCILLDILSFDIKELYILGYSFHKDSCIDEWLSQNGWNKDNYNNDIIQINDDGDNVYETDDINDWNQEIIHNNTKEFIFFKKEILMKDKRVNIDDSMKKILEI